MASIVIITKFFILTICKVCYLYFVILYLCFIFTTRNVIDVFSRHVRTSRIIELKAEKTMFIFCVS